MTDTDHSAEEKPGCWQVKEDSDLPRGTVMTGTVRSSDALARKIVMVEDGGAVHKFVWTSYAQLWRGGIDSSPSTLEPGMRVRIILHNPLFSGESVSQLELLPPSIEAKNQSGR